MSRIWAFVFLLMSFLALAHGEIVPTGFALGFIVLVVLLQHTDGDPP